MKLEHFGIKIISVEKLSEVPYIWGSPDNAREIDKYLNYFEKHDQEYLSLVRGEDIFACMYDGNSSYTEGNSIFTGWLFLHGDLTGRVKLLQSREFARVTVDLPSRLDKDAEIINMFLKKNYKSKLIGRQISIIVRK
jgi:hypothetical protein